ncbi:ABC transporter substrate-binding protein [Planosporangium mesophilum]|uniref:Peptide ABC transporter permease n=1 Tax=Planosporangium mesophilum TaxID=689768 RepID=A0A8J3TKT6_9ACTN|nr:ABC transporter substrate-binding protein [Planosporangium mesophilum]NJC85332.1 ABC transporter substrate-binding protein [Planosporangium mesophilum]GII23205.1 peptide ABC transporter permease [Planosporangium mesophilum]
MRPRWSPGAAAAALATAALALSACGSSGDTGATGGPRSGGTLTFAVGSDAGCLDPQQVGSNDTIYSLRQVVDSLTDQDPATGTIVPWLAEKWEISADARTFTFHLRSGATFSDGTPVNAQAVKDTFDAATKLGPKAALAVGYLSGYAGTKVVDDSTAEVSFIQSNAQFLQASSTFSLGLVSSASANKAPDQRCTEGIVGSGPFMLDKYVPNQSITLSRRSGYRWGSSLWKKSGEAYLDKLVFTVIAEAGVRSGSLQSGQVDAIGAVGLADESALKAGGMRLQTRANPGVVFNLGLNNSRPLFKDAAVRRALQVAIDRQQIVETIFPTGSKPATSVLAHTTPSYSDLYATLAFDAAKAKSLLDAAGWVPGADGIRAKGGTRLSFAITWFANAATNQPTLELIQQQLKAVGVEVTLKQLQIAQITQVQQSGDFDALWGNLTRADPDILRTLYSTQLANPYRLAPSDLDRVLTDQAATTDATKRQELVKQAQDLIVSNAYVVPVVELTTELGVRRNVHDLTFEASSRIQLHDTWKS